MIEFKDVSKEYIVGNQRIKALDKVSFEIEKNQFTVILGPSGSGKSTLLNLLGGMDRPTMGKIEIDSMGIEKFSDYELSDYRKNSIGFVFQFYNLIPNLTALENIKIAAQLTNKVELSEDMLKKVGLMKRKNNFPNQLSGGEMQRIAIARALAKNPPLILCDEPTGALDSHTGQKIIELLSNAKNSGTAVVLVTHNASIALMADKIIRLHDGKVVKVELNDSPLSIDRISW